MDFPDQFAIGTDEFLSIQIAGASGTPERFLLVGRPYDGLVRVREWTSHTFDSAGEDFDVAPRELLEDIETAYAAGLGVRPEMYEIRLWLGG